jgi:hypothetical protein
VASSKGTRFKKLIGSAIDFGAINFVFRLRTAINPKSLRFGVASTLETQTKQSLPCGFLGNLSLTCGFLVFQYIPCGFLGYLSLSCGFLDNLLMSCGFLDNLLIPCGFLGYQILSCGFLDSKQTSCGFLDVQQLACGFLVNITVSSGFVDNILPNVPCKNWKHFKRGRRLGKRGSSINELLCCPSRLPSTYPIYIPRANPTNKIEHTYFYQYHIYPSKEERVPTYSSYDNTKLCSFARECENITFCGILCLQDALYSLPSSFWNFYNFYQISPSFANSNRFLV